MRKRLTTTLILSALALAIFTAAGGNLQWLASTSGNLAIAALRAGYAIASSEQAVAAAGWAAGHPRSSAAGAAGALALMLLFRRWRGRRRVPQGLAPAGSWRASVERRLKTLDAAPLHDDQAAAIEKLKVRVDGLFDAAAARAADQDNLDACEVDNEKRLSDLEEGQPGNNKGEYSNWRAIKTLSTRLEKLEDRATQLRFQPDGWNALVLRVEELEVADLHRAQDVAKVQTAGGAAWDEDRVAAIEAITNKGHIGVTYEGHLELEVRVAAIEKQAELHKALFLENRKRVISLEGTVGELEKMQPTDRRRCHDERSSIRKRVISLEQTPRRIIIQPGQGGTGPDGGKGGDIIFTGEQYSLADVLAMSRRDDGGIAVLPPEPAEPQIGEVGCHYCHTPLDATPATGIYECPKCLKAFLGAVSVSDLLQRATRVKAPTPDPRIGESQEAMDAQAAAPAETLRRGEVSEEIWQFIQQLWPSQESKAAQSAPLPEPADPRIGESQEAMEAQAAQCEVVVMWPCSCGSISSRWKQGDHTPVGWVRCDGCGKLGRLP